MKYRRDVTKNRAKMLLSKCIGQYVWFVRCDSDRILRFEVGDPRLVVKIPRDRITDPNDRVSNVLNGRIVTPTGKWSFFIEDGLWNIDVDDLQCSRYDADLQNINTCLRRLEGQKICSVEICRGRFNLQIELDGLRRISVSHDGGFQDNCQWIVFLGDVANIGLQSEDEITIEANFILGDDDESGFEF